jgi:predicted MFS family arabinose efflux permease
LSFSVYVGVPLSSISLIFNNLIGWRLTHVLLGAVGILFGILGFIYIDYIEESADHKVKFPNYKQGFYVNNYQF